MKNKSILISWTGGLDSTYLVYDYLCKGYNVKTVYLDFIGNGQQSVREKKAIQDMISCYFGKFNHKHLVSNELSMFTGISNLHFQQMLPLILNLAYSYTDEDEVAVGYVMNDDAVSFIDEIQNLWSSINSFCKTPMPKLSFPLLKTKKD